MSKIYIHSKSKFTLLELLIAVLILVIISSVIVGVFRDTLLNYKKGMSYSEISQGLAGSFMVMGSDLSRMLPLGDIKTAYFKKESFSFIAISETKEKKSFLELIRYKFEKDKKSLYRAVVKYPSDIQNIDEKDIAFLEGVEELMFSYTHSKSKKKDNKSKNNDSGHDNKFEKTVTNENSLNKKDNKGNKGNKGNKKKEKPILITMSGSLKNGKIEESFITALFVTSMKGVSGSSGTSTDTEKKSSDNNSIEKNQQQK